MLRLSAGLIAAAVLAAGCARGGGEPPAPVTPPPIDPVGAYSFETTVEGQTVTGRVVIRGEPGNYTGMIEPDMGPPPIEIYSVTVEGQQVTVVGDAGGEDVVITMTFEGDTYTGNWVLGFDSGEISGRRIEQ
ncbi:MAG: hypothetical protein PVF27_03420 [Gemmatimonadales bacterium]|jgi:hypothetical protein